MKLDLMRILENMDIQGPSPVVPTVGSTIRTKKTQMTGKVERIEGDTVFFREGDGRLLKVPVGNVAVVQELADQDIDEDKTGDKLGSLVKKQNAKPSTVEKDYNGWKIRYKTSGLPVPWMVWHASQDPSKAHKGFSDSPEEAFADATAWINSGSGQDKKLSKNATVDFNVEFCREFSPDGQPFYAKIDDGYLTFSDTPQPGFKLSHVRAEGNVKFQCINISPSEAEGANVVPNGRYLLGEPEEIQPGVVMFPLQFQGTSLHSGDKLRMGAPGLTIAAGRVDEISTPALTKYKTAAAADARAADKEGDTARGNKRFHGIVQATKKQFANDAKKHTKEGTMGGINRCAPSQDVSYEKMLDEIMKEEEMKLNELSTEKMSDYVNAAKSPEYGYGGSKGRSLSQISKTVSDGLPRAGRKIAVKTGDRTGNRPKQGPIREKSLEERLREFLEMDEAFMNPWHGYVPGKKGDADPKLSPGGDPNKIHPDAEAPDSKLNALAKSPKSQMQGKDNIRFSQMVQDTIETHGLKWAFNFYVVKHGLSPREFQIFAGLGNGPAPKERAKPEWTDPSTTTKPKKQGMWSKLRSKLPFEE